MKADIKGITIGYTDQGSGLPLVCIHAFPLSKTMWQPQVNALADRYRVITIDLRGHGESDTILWNYTLDDYAADVIGLLDSLEVSRAVFAGLSMGGYLLFSIVRNFPAHVQGLILADTRAQADTEEGRAGRKAMAQTALKEGPSAIADLMMPKLLAPSTLQQRPDLVKQVRQMIVQTPREGIIVDLMAMAARSDSTGLLSTIGSPTLIIVGEEDQATPVAESRYMADRIPHATLVTIPEAGHLSNLEQSAAFNQSLRHFLHTRFAEGTH